jgi:hypothetical protein
MGMKSENQDSPPPNPFAVGTEEMQRAYEIPTVVANRFVLNWSTNGIRLAFGEQFAVEFSPTYRCAVALNIEDTISLYKLLQTALQNLGVSLEDKASD